MKKLIQVSVSLISGCVLAFLVYELYSLAPPAGSFLGKLSLIWGSTFLAFLLFNTLIFVITIVAVWSPNRLLPYKKEFFKIRDNLGISRWLFIPAIALIPAYILLFTHLGFVLTGPAIRLYCLVGSSLLIAFFLAEGEYGFVSLKSFIYGLVFTASIFSIADYLTNVTNYPFPLSWSEGNRFYDYSIYFGADLYNYSGTLPRNHYNPGRSMLWGLPFLIANTPIWLHRLWDAMLWTLPYVLFGILLGRKGGFKSGKLWIFGLWVYLFLTQGPIYTPLILTATIIFLFVHPERWLLSLIGVLIASFYATSSRYTWAAAPAIWATLILLSEFDLKEGETWSEILRKMIPVFFIATAGLVVSVIVYPPLIFPGMLTSTIAFSQPLLWFRLLPNATYDEGIIFGIAIRTIPLLILVIWLIISRKWRLNWLQKLVYFVTLIAFLCVGLIISVKIGGGNNLHNLDMYLVTLMFLAGLALQGIKPIQISSSPRWIQFLLILIVFLPAWSSYRVGEPLELPSKKIIAESLEAVRTEIEKTRDLGDVLFIDQRQLLIFKFIDNIEFIPDYEKKFVMDQALSNNSSYFRAFYENLASKKYALIVINPLSRKKQDLTEGFAAENNAWVRWVTRPVLCYYRPVYTSEEVRLQLLVPRRRPHDCPDYAKLKKK